ncbi:MAG: hypothetical protein KGL34_00930 [Gammaproteobacteria bacterium]|nr:hypothetical protein [Gammaproteobacteria bacterium]
MFEKLMTEGTVLEVETSPFAAPAFGSWVDFNRHRDELARIDLDYK